MLNSTYPTVYNNSKKESLWKLGYALFAWLKNHTIVFTKARKGKTVTANNVKFVGWLRVENTTKNDLKSVLLNMKDGLKEIQTKFSSIKELITIGIKKKFLRSSKNREKRMDTLRQKITEKETKKKLTAITMWQWQLNSVISSVPKFVTNVKLIVSHMLTTMIIRSHWKLFGFVAHVMAKNIERVFQRERLNLETPKGDAIVRPTDESSGGESEAVCPLGPKCLKYFLFSVQVTKVTEWLRHTAGCSFYQGQCITNDLWMQNLRSSGI